MPWIPEVRRPQLIRVSCIKLQGISYKPDVSTNSIANITGVDPGIFNGGRRGCGGGGGGMAKFSKYGPK